MSARTKGPWRIARDSSSVIVADIPKGEHKTSAVAYCGDELRHAEGLPFGPERDANAAFIVLACNAHDSLVAENARLRELLTDFADLSEPRELFPNLCAMARAALADLK